MPKLISIVIPTYKRNSLLQNLLYDLRAQIEASIQKECFEVIVVDNAPNRDARDICCQFAKWVTYLHEPRSGVVHARNAGVRKARGEYILFIDDDERPSENWLQAFRQQALKEVDACFGPVEPVFETNVPKELAGLLRAIFSRQLPVQTGADVSAWRAYLGSGNSMFQKATCLNIPEPFDVKFNDGGEDVALLRRLVDEKKLRLRWCQEGLVYESVPQARMNTGFIAARKFKDGQIRCRVEKQSQNIKGDMRVFFWMIVGVIQVVFFGAKTMILKTARSPKAIESSMRMLGGMGKVLWW